MGIGDDSEDCKVSALTIVKPKLGGKPVDWCMSEGKDCGRPVIQALCQKFFLTDAMDEEAYEKKGAEDQTGYVDGGTCGQKGLFSKQCYSIEQIRCKSC